MLGVTKVKKSRQSRELFAGSPRPVGSPATIISSSNTPQTYARNVTEGTGAVAWSNLNNFLNASPSSALCNFPEAPKRVNLSNFGFSLPTTTTSIDGFELSITRSVQNQVDGYTFVTNTSSGFYGLEKPDTTSSAQRGDTVGDDWTDTGNGTFVYGGPTDLWGLTITKSEVEDSDFKVIIGVSSSGASGSATAVINRARLTVYYTTEDPNFL